MTSGLPRGFHEDVEHLCHPRRDFLEIKRQMDAELLDYSVYEKSPIGRQLSHLETLLRSDLYLAYLGLRRRNSFRTIFAFSERVGIPFAGLRRFLGGGSSFITMLQCWSRRQELAFKTLRLVNHIDAFAVHCRSMKENLVRLGADPDCVNVLPYCVDERFFFDPGYEHPQSGFLFSIGEPRTRDYRALISAVRNLPVKVAVAAAGMRSARQADNLNGLSTPENVVLTNYLSPLELRKMYSRAQLVVLPVNDSVASFGATATLEAACMRRPVVAFASRGLQDFIVDGETGILVPPGDATALRGAIEELISKPSKARRMGENARQRVEEEFGFERYVQSMIDLISRH